jgi:hypothetical protein
MHQWRNQQRAATYHPLTAKGWSLSNFGGAVASFHATSDLQRDGGSRRSRERTSVRRDPSQLRARADSEAKQKRPRLKRVVGRFGRTALPRKLLNHTVLLGGARGNGPIGLRVEAKPIPAVCAMVMTSKTLELTSGPRSASFDTPASLELQARITSENYKRELQARIASENCERELRARIRSAAALPPLLLPGPPTGVPPGSAVNRFVYLPNLRDNRQGRPPR